MHPFRLSVALLLAVPAPAPAAPAPPTELVDYVTRKDDSFAWALAGTESTDAGTVYAIDLVSQTWHDVKWDHKLQVFVPKGAKPRATMVLWNQGGKPDLVSTALGLKIAERVKAPVAFLFGVPKQPLFEGKKEDGLIAETFVRYLDTGDGSWPLLFPMVKSVVRAMDALQQFARKEWGFEVKSFVVTGASKRGWTAWLTGATGDKRVKAIAPIVIDTLNLPAQMRNQVAAFGKPSEMIRDYTARKLVPIPETGAGEKLWKMVDPWSYRDRLTMPKLIINGANDPYWPVDALNSYWDDLKGDKWVLYVPNAGHDLRQRGADGEKELLPMRAVDTLSAFARCMIFDKPMPQVDVTYKVEDGRLWVEPQPYRKSQHLWTAQADTRDFRKAVWKESDGGFRAVAFGPPARGFRAVFVETEFESDGLKFDLSSRLRIQGAADK